MKNVKRVVNPPVTSDNSPWDGATATEVFIRRVKKDESLQVRRRIDPAAVKRYVSIIQSGKEMPPVKVALIDDVPVLIDGWHRFAALERLGEDQATALVVKLTQQDAYWHAAKANLEHGLALKAGEL